MTRGKRLLSLLLSVLMLCTLLPPRASAAPTLYFTAVNDRMCDLSDETMPFWQNGLLYVAGATVDGPDDLGIRYSYNQEKSVAILYKGQRVLYCDLTAGTMENNRTGEQYAGSPIVRSGMVFFPITALAKMFDLKYSSTKIAYGYLLRIRDDNAVLSDEYFIDAATDPIQKRYAQYERAHAAAEQENETPAQVETPVRRDDLTVYLLLPAANGSMLTQLLSTLENYQSHATLLLTPELLESAGDGVRRAAATGNAVALRVKNAQGELLYDSALQEAIDVNAVKGSSGANAVIAALTGSEVYTIARINATHDSLYSFAHMADAGVLQLNYAGYIWYDPDSTFYLAPEKPAARQYIVSVARECAELGFDELLFDEFGYPTRGRLNNIDESARTLSKSAALAQLAEELRSGTEAYGVRLSVQLDAATVLAGGNETAGQDLAALAAAFDRIYVETTAEQLPALTAALEPYDAELVPILSEAPASGSYLLTA